jgi:hypothetical protein
MGSRPLVRISAFLLLCCGVLSASELNVQLSIGHHASRLQPFYVRLSATAGTDRVERLLAASGSRGTTSAKEALWSGEAGGGQVASATFTLRYTEDSEPRTRPIHVMWADLLNHSDPNTARRLSQDADSSNSDAKVRLLFGKEKATGFSFTAAQLKTQRALWVPSYDLLITLADNPISFEAYERSQKAQSSETILEGVARQEEASYDDFLSKWADMGSPAYIHPRQPLPGHIICLTWDSAIPKFGIDRGSGVWNDYGNPDHFRFWFSFGDLTQGIIHEWKGQRLADGLPIVTTTLEKDGVRYEVEQFAYPLAGPPKGRKGDISMVLLQKVRLTNLRDVDRVVPVSMSHRRAVRIQTEPSVEFQASRGQWLFVEAARKEALLSLQGIDSPPVWHETLDYENEDKRVAGSVRFDLTVAESLKAGQSKEFIVKLPSPVVATDETEEFASLDYASARSATQQFWSDWASRGVQFQVPEKAVNDMFRASLWHALRLPRRHGGEGAVMDLPYSNFAYDQTGIPWPGVHSIYVDYMLYELRGLYPVALEELLNEFRLNQDVSGHESGFANWMMYTPSMLYASGQYYLLSHDRAGFQQLLPYALKALAWCEKEYTRAAAREDFTGLVEGPLNDGTGEGVWALNQAYLYAGLERFGKALTEYGDPHGAPALAEAEQLRSAIEDGFARATSDASLVQLRDGSWQPFVPSDARTPRRLMDVWYPTDVDTGPLHLVRLKALRADSPLSQYMLNDHEDNLFLNGWGMANEPVYEPQALGYLQLDNQKAAIRAFYSQMACAFSHSVFEPVEHRWMHGQYFGPPSTDGAWFELYRKLLVREMDDNTLIIGQATPRRWLQDGKEIRAAQAPTYFGEVSFRIASHTDRNLISANVDLVPQTAPRTLLVRLRHPNGKPVKSVEVNGSSWKDFDPAKEWVRIQNPQSAHYEIAASY